MSFVDRLKQYNETEQAAEESWKYTAGETKILPPGTPFNVKLSKGQRYRINKADKKAKKIERREEEAKRHQPTKEEIEAVNKEWDENLKEPS